MNSTNINFKQIGKLMTIENEDKDQIEFRKEIESLKNNNDHKKIYDLCSNLLKKFETGAYSNKSLELNIREEILKVSNILIVDRLKNKKLEEAKIYMDTLNQIKSPNFDLFTASTNNKSCYYSSTGFNRNSIDLMKCLNQIVIVKSCRDIICESNVNLTYAATSNLQLCAFNSQNKQNYQAYINGLSALALTQFHQVILNLKTKVIASSSSENNEHQAEAIQQLETITLDKTNSYNLIITYYNIGVQQEFMKRFTDSNISFKKAYYFKQFYPDFDKKLGSKLSVIAEIEQPKIKFSNHQRNASKIKISIKDQKESSLKILKEDLKKKSLVTDKKLRNSSISPFKDEAHRMSSYEEDEKINLAKQMINIKSLIK